MSSNHKFSTWAEIDLGAIENNVQLLAKSTQAEIMAVLKANAYGHGVIPVSQAVLRAGATWCGLARVEEALELRFSGFNGPILVLGFTAPGRVRALIEADVSMAVWSEEQLERFADAASEAGKPARLHLKVDTGMGRLGAMPEKTLGLAERISQRRGVLFEGIFTHFARADETDPSPTDEQDKNLKHVLKELDKAGLRPPLVHAANSAASLTRPNAHYNMIRAGIAIFGLHPSAECRLPSGFQPAIMWKSQLSQVRMLPPGRGVSYGHEYITSGNERIGIVPVGYADGFRRTPGNQVLVGGKRVPVVGRVCMDQISLQLDAVPDANVGDEVVLIGRQGEETMSAAEVAKCWGTIHYEVICGLSPRVHRIYDSNQYRTNT
ncbi:MAG TPA: alanine racemase [Anaerolineae bacterium]|nr:alanine racemase [Anaerolineae bacterium]